MNASAHGVRRKSRTAIHAVIVPALLLLSAPGWAQEPPAPQPAEAHKVLADDAGTWDAVVKMYHRGPAAPATESRGVETNELVCGGLYSRSTFKYQMGGREFEGHGLIGYDPRSKEYVGTWVDNFSAIPSSVTGKYDAKQKTLTLFSKAVDDSGNEMTTKQVTTFVDGKTKTLQIFLVVETGGRTRDVKLMDVTSKTRP
jgi:hypothetical protein